MTRMGEEVERGVRLYGSWGSPFSSRVIWALKLKGIPFHYIEEDLSNKSEMLLEYNPVHKKIPVLLHNGRPICESMIIIEYLEEMWPQHQALLPTHPFDRARARFWVKFAEDKSVCIWMLFRSTGEKAKKDSLEMLRVVDEDALKEGNKYFGGDEMGIVDLAFGVIAHWIGVIEEVSGLKLIDCENNKFPRFQAWMKNFKESPIICDNLPNAQAMIQFFGQIRHNLLSTTPQT